MLVPRGNFLPLSLPPKVFRAYQEIGLKGFRVGPFRPATFFLSSRCFVEVPHTFSSSPLCESVALSRAPLFRRNPQSRRLSFPSYDARALNSYPRHHSADHSAQYTPSSSLYPLFECFHPPTRRMPFENTQFLASGPLAARRKPTSGKPSPFPRTEIWKYYPSPSQWMSSTP